MATIDRIVARVLTEKFRLGLFEKTFEDSAKPPALRTPDVVAAALEAARQSITVLDNRGSVLPLDPSAKLRLAVIGPTAADPLAQLSGYSYPAHVVLHNQAEDTRHIVTPLQALQGVFGEDRVRYARGCQIIEVRRKGTPVFPGDVMKEAVRPTSPLSHRTDEIADAVQAARAADVAIVCLGDLAGLFQTGTIGEGSDTDSLNLPGVQQQLLQAVVDTGTPTVVVLIGGRPYNLGGLEERLAAYVMAYAGGQQAGNAIAQVLAGQAEPSGRLTVSVPLNVGAMPYSYNHKLKSGGTPIAFHFGSHYPFGHGLSYTNFEYRKLEVESASVPMDGEIVLSFEVSNTGSRRGVEVPQLYVRDRLASVVRPLLELKAFQRVELNSGETARVKFRVPVDMLCFTGMAGQRIVEPGMFDLAIGASSADIRARAEIEVTGATRTLPRDWRMESRCEVRPA
jgi:beta-glucosidase